MGTELIARGIASSCNEELNLSHPAHIGDIHRSYLEAGADIITANTFGASAISLSEHNLAAKVREINLAACDIAKSAADRASTSKKPRFVAGDLGPSSKIPTLGAITFDEMFDTYFEQIEALMEGAVDLLLVETAQDPLQIKCALAAAHSVFRKIKRTIPIFASVTIEKTGTMLLGTGIEAALASILPYNIDAFGINCSTGPELMEEHLQFLSHNCPVPILCQPNAGMPEMRYGRLFYTLGPERYAEILSDYIRRFGIIFAGGCCGTTSKHIEALAKKIADMGAPKRSVSAIAAVSSLYASVSIDQEPRPFIVAEQTNVNGSKKFRDLLISNDYDSMAEIGAVVSNSSHALDLCLAYAGRDECRDTLEVVRRLVPKAQAALMIDSTNPVAIEAALKIIPGRAIINSINLEDGGEKARRILFLAQRFGAAVVALTIDEEGMAKTAKNKLAIAQRIAKLAGEQGLSIDDILFDPLTFTLASGDKEFENAGRETLNGIRLIKAKIKGARTVLGVSNISYGLKPSARRVLTSVFLHRAISAGLDAAIINPAKIVPLHTISDEEVALCNSLIENDVSNGDPLSALIKKFEGTLSSEKSSASVPESATPEEALRSVVVNGNLGLLQSAIDSVLQNTTPTNIINTILLPAMQEVGALFGNGKLPLPFVLQSAEVMRAAVNLITPHMKADSVAHRGTLVLATVRGDVHDIGKNLVDVIVAGNGYRVINLGIRQTAQAVMRAAKENGASAVGLSGLLVSSTEIMREDLEAFRTNGLTIPVLCGGAALTKSFVEQVLTPAYGNKVYYCADAFAGLTAMNEITK